MRKLKPFPQTSFVEFLQIQYEISVGGKPAPIQKCGSSSKEVIPIVVLSNYEQKCQYSNLIVLFVSKVLSLLDPCINQRIEFTWKNTAAKDSIAHIVRQKA